VSTILIQGLGCTETGAQIVLRELVLSAPSNAKVFVICNLETRSLLEGKAPPNVILIGLSHKIWGRWLRIPLEVFIGFLGLARLVKTVINLSHYGLCLGGDYALYIHSPLLMAAEASGGWSEGKSNPVKRWMLNSCIRRARVICVQTPLMRDHLEGYCARGSIKPKRVALLLPQVVRADDQVAEVRLYDFQVFYPTSRFEHKRADLAVQGASEAHRRDKSYGLVITVAASEPVGGVHFLGPVTHAMVHRQFGVADALLFTSERETLGLPLLESLSYGLPVIAPRLPYATTLLGDAACYFDQPTAEAVAEAIKECRARYDEYSARARERYRYLFGVSSTWPEHWSVLLGRVEQPAEGAV